jgi:hypothetical protein
MTDTAETTEIKNGHRSGDEAGAEEVRKSWLKGMVQLQQRAQRAGGPGAGGRGGRGGPALPPGAGGGRGGGKKGGGKKGGK